MSLLKKIVKAFTKKASGKKFVGDFTDFNYLHQTNLPTSEQN